MNHVDSEQLRREELEFRDTLGGLAPLTGERLANHLASWGIYGNVSYADPACPADRPVSSVTITNQGAGYSQPPAFCYSGVEQNIPVKTQRKDVYGNVPPINLSLTSRAAYDRIAELEARVTMLEAENLRLNDRIAALAEPPTEQKPSTGDLLARASSFDRPLDAYAR